MGEKTGGWECRSHKRVGIYILKRIVWEKKIKQAFPFTLSVLREEGKKNNKKKKQIYIQASIHQMSTEKRQQSDLNY